MKIDNDHAEKNCNSKNSINDQRQIAFDYHVRDEHDAMMESTTIANSSEAFHLAAKLFQRFSLLLLAKINSS